MSAKKPSTQNKTAKKKAAPKKYKDGRKKLSDEEYAPLSELFWDLASPILAKPKTEEGTMMGTPCLRVNGEFFSMVSKSFSGRLIVKLPAEAVQGHIADGVGESFAPAGKVMKEWLWVLETDAKLWEALMLESWGFVSSLPPKKKKPAKKKSNKK